uniref:(S)-2-hydroxy-acid oxidase n=1 Tax=Chenopodium quinoa TaxID=63459 RepID=A0A803KQY5_CHEQI
MATEPVNVNEYQELARRALPKMYYDFYAAGAEDEHTLKENVKAFSRISFNINRFYKLLLLVLTVGEIATAKAAAASETIMVLSFSSNSTLEEVSASCTAVFRNREVSAWLVQRAEKSGYKAIVVTVDTPKLGRREANIKNKMIAPQVKNLEGYMSTEVVNDKGSGPQAFANSYYDASFSWKDINWLKSITKLPIMIKGVLTHEDATRAAEIGVDGIIVSNHGARQLDYAPATFSVLEEVVHAVGGKVPVLLDGGVRRETDIFKALALGARAVLVRLPYFYQISIPIHVISNVTVAHTANVGRPVIYGLAAKGEDGVKKVIGLLKDELELTLALAGCSSIKDITRNHVRTEHERPQSLL